MYSRRIFLKNGGLALVSLGFAPAFLARTASQRGARPAKVLIAIFQRGAVDGLNMVVPFGERDVLPRAAEHRDRAVRAPALTPRDRPRRLLRAAPAAGAAEAALGRAAARDRARVRIARRHAVALRRAGLHGEATPGVKSTPDGWLNRYLHAREHAAPATPFRAVALAPAAAADAAGDRAGARDRADRAVRDPRRPGARDSRAGVVRGGVRRGRRPACCTGPGAKRSTR